MIIIINKILGIFFVYTQYRLIIVGCYFKMGLSIRILQIVICNTLFSVSMCQGKLNTAFIIISDFRFQISDKPKC